MNKKAKSFLQFSFITLLILGVIILSHFISVSAVSIVTNLTNPVGLSVTEDNYTIFNFTIWNTNLSVSANITQVVIVLPTGFSFDISNRTNGTSSASNRTIITTATSINWTNASGSYHMMANGSNASFYFNATAATPGNYNFTIFVQDIFGIVNATNVSILVNDTTAPSTVAFAGVSPANYSIIGANLTINISVTDNANLSAIKINLINSTSDVLNSSIKGISSFSNDSYAITFYNLAAGLYFINATANDTYNNVNTSEPRTFRIMGSVFLFNGTIKDEDGNLLNNSIVNITIRNQAGFSVMAYITGNSNESGQFNVSVPSNSSWLYEPSFTQKNSTFNNVAFKSKTIPAFPSNMITQLVDTIFYLTPAGTINITAINGSGGGRAPFNYQVKDTKLGYPIASNFDSMVTEAIVYVPRNRNYSIMIYPNQSMPVSFEWNNFTVTSSYNFTPGNSSYNATTYTLHKQFNTSMTMASVTGFFNVSGANSFNNLTVIPYIIEPGNMVHAEYGDMPYNLSAMIGRTDNYTLANGFFNISVPATIETSKILVFATAINNSEIYGGVKNMSLPFGTVSTAINITGYGLFGTNSTITMNRLDGGGASIAIPTKAMMFYVLNSTNNTMASTMAHAEVTFNYSSLGAEEFTWMIDVQQSSATANFSLPLLNNTGIKEMNLFVSGGAGGSGGQYAPKRVSYTASQLGINKSIVVNNFNPGDIQGTLGASSISISLYISNSTCDVPNPPSACLLSSSTTMETFNPMKAVMGGGKISFRMGSGGILVHYVNVDMLASGPPDALFDSGADTNATAGSSFSSAMKFGSGGPTIYDYVIISVPYSESAGSGLNESAAINISIPVLYDDNWNVVWNTSTNGSNPSALAANNSHYAPRMAEWGNLTRSSACIGTSTYTNSVNTTDPCFIDTTNNRVWIRLPHFSGTGAALSGSVLASSTSTTTSSSGGGSTTWTWSSTHSLTNEQFASGFSKELGTKARIKFDIANEAHHVGVISLTTTSAIINISSNKSHQETFNIGDEKKFEVTNDNFYDVYVKLNGIANSKANVTIKSIHEAISATTPTTPTTPTTGTNQTGGTTPPTKSNTLLYVIIAVILVIIIAVIVAVILYSRKR